MRFWRDIYQLDNNAFMNGYDIKKVIDLLSTSLEFKKKKKEKKKNERRKFKGLGVKVY